MSSLWYSLGVAGYLENNARSAKLNTGTIKIMERLFKESLAGSAGFGYHPLSLPQPEGFLF